MTAEATTDGGKSSNPSSYDTFKISLCIIITIIAKLDLLYLERRICKVSNELVECLSDAVHLARLDPSAAQQVAFGRQRIREELKYIRTEILNA